MKKKSLFTILVLCYVVFVVFFYGMDSLKLNKIPFSVHLFYPLGNERIMFRAVKNGNLKKIRKILESKNIDVNQLDRSSKISYLKVALIYEQKEVISLLLEYGASPDICRDSQQAFSIALDAPDPFYMEIFLEYPENFVNYVEAISGYSFWWLEDRNERLRRFELLYESGANPNKDRPGLNLPPIREALYEFDYDRVLILLKYNVELNDYTISLMKKTPDSFKNKVSNANREDVIAYIKKYYDIDILLEKVVDMEVSND